MSERIVRPLLTVGYDKNGELDWSIPITPLENLTVEQMIVIRSHLMLAYREIDDYWRQFGPPSRDFTSKAGA
jgi:hypothetical protein